MNSRKERIEAVLKEEELKSQVLKDAEALVQEWSSLSLVERTRRRSGIISRALNLEENQIEAIRGLFAEAKIYPKASFNKSLREARQARDGRVETPEPTPEEIAREKAECQDRAAELILCENLLDKAVERTKALGLAGEERNVKILYLAMTSRLFSRPVNVVVKGPSSGGKSFVVEIVCKLHPESAYYSLTSLSERALAYSPEPLVHRYLVLYEAAGLGGEFGQYILRSLLSEGKIRYETVEKTQDGLKSRFIEREGPTGLIITTTRAGLHPELETRLFSLTVDDTPEQTREVLLAHAGGDAKEKPDLIPWHSYQRLLELENTEVKVPYAEELARRCSAKAVRLRRDFGQILTLIKAHALLHLYHRPRDGNGQIVSTLDDYAAVCELVSDLVAEGVGSAVSEAIRETVEIVGALLNEMEAVQIMHVADALNMSKQAAWSRVKKAIYGGWLVNQTEKKGKPARMVLGDPLPKPETVLPLPETLAEIIENAYTSADRLTGLPPIISSIKSNDYPSTTPKWTPIDRLTDEIDEGIERSTGQPSVNHPELTDNNMESLEKEPMVNRSTSTPEDKNGRDDDLEEVTI